MVHYELNLRDYLRIIRKRKFIIIASAIIFGFISYLYISSEIPLYESSTTVKIEDRKTVAGMLTELIVFNPGDLMETQTKVIRSNDVMKHAAVKMELIEASDLKSKDSVITARVQSIAVSIQDSIETERVGQTNIIKIIAISTNAQRAYDMAHSVREAYIDYNLAEKTRSARELREFVEKQLREVEDRLRVEEDKVEAFGQEIEDIRIADSVQKKLIDLEFEKTSLSQKYTARHPMVLRIQEQMTQLESQIQGFSGNQLEFARLSREVEVNKKIYSMLREKLEEVRIREAEGVSDVARVDPPLLPKRPINTQSNTGVLLGALLGLVVGMILSFVTESLDTSVGTIDDVEELMQLPVLGIVPSVHRENESDLSFFQRMKRKLMFKKGSEEDKKYARLISHHKPTSPISESFRNIKTNIKFSPLRKVLMLTSSGPQEGKTTILINLGLVCAQEGFKTLIISSDLRRPAIAESFGFDKRPGLSDIIMGTASLQEALRGTSDMMLGDLNIEAVLSHPGLDHLWILPSGAIPLNPMEILDSKELDDLLVKIKDEFDIILFDSPPVLPVADASILSPRVDGVVLCYEIGKTSRHALVRTKMQLESSGANILGIVLNHIQPETEAVETYPYYYKYKYRDYSSKKDPDSRKKKTT